MWVSACKGSNHLAGILASLKEASTDHVVGDLPRVGGLALGLTQERGVQALQQLRVVGFEEQEEIRERETRVRPGRGWQSSADPEGSQERTPAMDLGPRMTIANPSLEVTITSATFVLSSDARCQLLETASLWSPAECCV